MSIEGVGVLIFVGQTTMPMNIIDPNPSPALEAIEEEYSIVRNPFTVQADKEIMKEMRRTIEPKKKQPYWKQFKRGKYE